MIPGSKIPSGRARLVAALLALLAAAPAAAAEGTPPDAFVRAEIRALADVLGGGARNRLDRVRDRIRAVVDFEGFARRSLGSTWGTLRPDEQERFRAALQRLLEGHYMARPTSIFDERKVSVGSARSHGDEAAVPLTVVRKDVDVTVVLKLRRAGVGWIAEDVEIDGLGLLEDYRAQFRTFLKKRSMRELIELLESRANEKYGSR